MIALALFLAASAQDAPPSDQEPTTVEVSGGPAPASVHVRGDATVRTEDGGHVDLHRDSWGSPSAVFAGIGGILTILAGAGLLRAPELLRRVVREAPMNPEQSKKLDKVYDLALKLEERSKAQRRDTVRINGRVERLGRATQALMIHAGMNGQAKILDDPPTAEELKLDENLELDDEDADPEHASDPAEPDAA
jgi:hypothetical protein